MMADVPQRLILAATPLFAARGFAGASVRAICAAAETNANAVTYHFGSKQKLYAAVILGIGERRLASARRLLDLPARSTEELESRLILFAEETMISWLEEPGVLTILLAELQQGFRNCGPEAMEGLEAQMRVLIGFLTSAQQAGLIREGVDIAIMAGGLVERLNTQIMHADVIAAQHGKSIEEPSYRRYWVEQVVGMMLRGACQR